MKLNTSKLLQGTTSALLKDTKVRLTGLTSMSRVEGSLSSGLLTVDLTIGGGWAPNRQSSMIGLEGSGKSTIAYTALRGAIEREIPLYYFDHEGTTDAGYVSRILGRNVDDIILTDMEDTDDLDSNQVFYYFRPETGEKVFRLMHRLLKSLPDKFQDTDGKWWYMFLKPESAVVSWEKGILKMLDEQGVKEHHKDYAGNIITEAPNGDPQAVFVIDSWASMLPESRDENDESSPMAKAARMFSDNLPLIASLKSNKRVAILGINQLRERPMAMGDPTYEPGGNALKHYTEVRLEMRKISHNTAGGNPDEPCWDGVGRDRYTYSRIRTPKNKAFSPNRECLVRFCFESKGEPGYGADPVYDVVQYLRMTGQYEGAGKYRFGVKGLWQKRAWNWQELKELVQNPDRDAVILKFGLADENFEKALRIVSKPVEINKLSAEERERRYRAYQILSKARRECDIQRACRAQIESGEAFALFAKVASGGGGSKEKSSDKGGSMTREDSND